MANTTVVLGKTVEITGLDTDWVWSTDLPVYLRGRPLSGVVVKPSAATDVVTLRTGSVSGPRCWWSDGSFQNQRQGYFGPDSGIDPAIKISECSFTTVANAVIMLNFQ
jgi:hypothetical protein